MPTFRVTAPDGTVYHATGPDDATEQHALDVVRAHHEATPAEQTAIDVASTGGGAATPAQAEATLMDVMKDPESSTPAKLATLIPWVPLHVLNGLINSASSAITAPRRAATGEMSPEDMPAEALNMAGFATTGAYGGSSLLGPEGKVLGAGVRGGRGILNTTEHEFTKDAYHGSPRDIKEFDSGVHGTPEGHYGAHNYFTNSPEDASINYASEGPDLTGRIEREIEATADAGPEIDDQILGHWNEKGVDVDSIDDLTEDQKYEAMRDMARRRLGVENQGTVYPVKLKMKNPVVVGGKDETFFGFKESEKGEGPEEGFDREGPAADLMQETERTMQRWGVSDHDINDVMQKLYDEVNDRDGISASDFEDIVRHNVNEVYDDMTGEMASPGAVISDVYQGLGFDGVDMDAHAAFNERRGFGGVKMPGMAGVSPETRHYIVFDPKNIRSRFAQFDPAKVDSGDILGAGVTKDGDRRGALVAAGVQSDLNDAGLINSTKTLPAVSDKMIEAAANKNPDAIAHLAEIVGEPVPTTADGVQALIQRVTNQETTRRGFLGQIAGAAVNSVIPKPSLGILKGLVPDATKAVAQTAADAVNPSALTTLQLMRQAKGWLKRPVDFGVDQDTGEFVYNKKDPSELRDVMRDWHDSREWSG